MHRKTSDPSSDKILPSGGQITDISRSAQKIRAVPPLLSSKDDIVDNMKRDMIMAEQGVASTVYGHLLEGRTNRIAELKTYIEYGNASQRSEGKMELLNLITVPPPQFEIV